MGCVGCNSVIKKTSGCKSSNSDCSRCNKFSVFDWLSNIPPTSNEKQCSIIELSFKNGRKKYYSNKKSLKLKVGDPIVVKSLVGYDIGLVSLKGELVRLQINRKKIKKDDINCLLRPASQLDLDLWKKAICLEKSTMLQTREIVKKLGLDMKITDVEYQADGKRAIFYYVAERRIDFRELIKILIKKFNIKTVLRQLGARQESAIVGGIGVCGRELCCSSWLFDIRSVSISAARYQNLALNPQKLAGQCGKLKCCLNYELQNYMQSLKKFPNTKTLIKTNRGKATVQKIDIFKKLIWYSYVKNYQDWFVISVDSVNKMIALNKSGDESFSLEDFTCKKMI